jgi:mRNA-degrading endonuclease toxin of MazEF toxin-antitoxin module
MADQLATVSKLRLMKRFGHVSPKDMRGVERVIKIQLALPFGQGKTVNDDSGF